MAGDGATSANRYGHDGAPGGDTASESRSLGDGSLSTRLDNAERRRIADIALRLFAQHGYSQVTMRDVAEASGVSRATIFRYFSKKENLILASLDDLMQEMARLIENLGSTPERPCVLDLEPVCHDLAVLVTAKIDGVLPPRTEVSQDSSLVDHLARAQSQAEDLMAVLLARRAGIFAPDIEMQVCARVTIVLFVAALDAWLIAAPSSSLNDLVDEAFRAFERVATPRQ